MQARPITNSPDTDPLDTDPLDTDPLNRVPWFDNEHPSLRHCWHPIADLRDLDGPGPHPVRLLGQDWALFRADGTWVLLPDRCPHRLAPLTAGALIVQPSGKTALQCGYHGWCFDAGGSCVSIPATATGHVPSTAHLRPAATTTEAFGLVWASIEPPMIGLPEVPEWGDDRFGLAHLPVQPWQASAGQMIDNFLDVAHFPFTHTATIGDAGDQQVGEYELNRTGWVFSALHRHSAKLLDGSGRLTERTMQFECTAPHHLRLRLDYGEHGVVVLLFFHQPVDVGATNLYCMQMDTAIPSPDPDEERANVAHAIAFQQSVGAEDRQLLERIARKGVPLDLSAEVHTRADRITVELRRVLADLAAATGATDQAQ